MTRCKTVRRREGFHATLLLGPPINSRRPPGAPSWWWWWSSWRGRWFCTSRCRSRRWESPATSTISTTAGRSSPTLEAPEFLGSSSLKFEKGKGVRQFSILTISCRRGGEPLYWAFSILCSKWKAPETPHSTFFSSRNRAFLERLTLTPEFLFAKLSLPNSGVDDEQDARIRLQLTATLEFLS